MIADFVEAVRFLTLLPLPRRWKKGDLPHAMFFFPLVGFLIGVFSLAVAYGLSPYLFPRLQALVLVTVPILVTGGLHVDGLADFCDGFFGGKSKSDVLRIMRDSRVGVWGALGVALLLLWKLEFLAALPGRGGPLLLSLVAGRWAQVVLCYFLPYANPVGGLGEAVARKVKVRELAGATAFLAVLVFFLSAPGIVCFLALLPFLAALGLAFQKRVGGVTGDLLGAASEMTEVFVLFFYFLIQSGGMK